MKYIKKLVRSIILNLKDTSEALEEIRKRGLGSIN